MKTITNEQFIEYLERWKLIITQAGIVLPNGNPVHDKFFHVFLGLGYSTFKMLVSGQGSMRVIQPYVAKSINFADRLSKDAFLEEVE
ncbi:MAG: hypothetical protein HAW67_00175, partial [Endozoicomonadaceae bacterium]|nr:hypothetical protein [Endozoicomonadaceae bacterium]